MISLEDIKDYLNIEDDGLDNVLQLIESGAVKFVESYTDRYFGPLENVTFTIDGGVGRRLWLPDPLTGQPTEVRERRGLASDFDVLAADEYEYEPGERSIHRLNLDWPCELRSVQVEGERGYPTDGEPEDIRQAVLVIIGFTYKERPRELPLDVSRFISSRLRLPAHVTFALDRHRRVS